MDRELHERVDAVTDRAERIAELRLRCEKAQSGDFVSVETDSINAVLKALDYARSRLDELAKAPIEIFQLTRERDLLKRDVDAYKSFVIATSKAQGISLAAWQCCCGKRFIAERRIPCPACGEAVVSDCLGRIS